MIEQYEKALCSIYSGKETSMDDWKPDERTVRMCIDALPGTETSFASAAFQYRLSALQNLTSILPKPDPAKALVDEWERDGRGKSSSADGYAVDLVRWLIDNDRIKP